MATTADIHERLVDLCALITGVETSEAWWPDSEIPFQDAQLTAAIVMPAPNLRNQIISSREYTSGQDWILAFLVKRFPKDYKLRDRDTWDLILPYAERVPDFFNARRGLQMNDAGIAVGISLPAITSLAPATFDRAMYAAVGFRMTTNSIRIS